jgi:hypothetical protein
MTGAHGPQEWNPVWDYLPAPSQKICRDEQRTDIVDVGALSSCRQGMEGGPIKYRKLRGTETLLIRNTTMHYPSTL